MTEAVPGAGPATVWTRRPRLRIWPFPLSADPTIYLADLRSGVYRSTNGGDSWRPINDGLLVRAVNALALSADDGCLYAATEGSGVFRLDLK
jgi:hypothetical protein